MKGSVLRIAAWLQPQSILLDIDVPDRESALERAAGEIGRVNAIDPAPLFRALCRRELSGSTALGDGFAIPHARMVGIPRPLTMFLRTRQPVPFHAPDAKPVSDLLVIMVPADGENEDHLQLLALVAELFQDRSFRAGLHVSSDHDAAAQVFRSGIAKLLAGTS